MRPKHRNARRGLWSVALCGLLWAGAARAADVTALVGKLGAELKKTAEAAKTTEKGPGRSGSYNAYEGERAQGQQAKLENALARESFDEAQQALSQLAAARLTPEAKELVVQIQKQLPELQEKQSAAFLVQVDEALVKAADACLSARKDSDLDAALGRLNALRQRRTDSFGNTTEPRMRANTKLEGAIRFLGRWQEYLTQSAAGYDAAAASILRELAEMPNGYPLLPRSKILARIGPEAAADTPPPDAPLRAVKDLDDLPKALAELSRAGTTRRSLGDVFASSGGSLSGEVGRLAQGHAAFKAGFYGQAFAVACASDAGSLPGSREVLRLRMLLLSEVLPRYLELPEAGRPKAGETASDFLLRLAAESAAKGEWDQLHRILDAYRQSAFGLRPPAWLEADLATCAAFIAGRNLEEAGCFAAAAASYERALKQVGKFGPAKAAVVRLAVIAKEHPEALAAAAKEAAAEAPAR